MYKPYKDFPKVREIVDTKENEKTIAIKKMYKEILPKLVNTFTTLRNDPAWPTKEKVVKLLPLITIAPPNEKTETALEKWRVRSENFTTTRDALADTMTTILQTLRLIPRLKESSDYYNDLATNIDHLLLVGQNKQISSDMDYRKTQLALGKQQLNSTLTKQQLDKLTLKNLDKLKQLQVNINRLRLPPPL